MEDVRKIKQLQSQLNKMIADAEVMKIDVANKQREYDRKLSAIADIKKLIEGMCKTDDIKLSEHAVIRYLERVKGLDVQSIKDDILTEEVTYLINTLGNGKYPINDFNIVVKDKTVITII